MKEKKPFLVVMERSERLGYSTWNARMAPCRLRDFGDECVFSYIIIIVKRVITEHFPVDLKSYLDRPDFIVKNIPQ